MATDRRDDQDTVTLAWYDGTIFNSLDKSEAKTRSEYIVMGYKLFLRMQSSSKISRLLLDTA